MIWSPYFLSRERDWILWKSRNRRRR